MKKSILTIIICAAVIAGAYYYFHKNTLTTKEVSSVPATAWEGKWVRENSNNFDYSVVTISDVTSKTFKFDLEALQGSNTGTWSNNEEVFGLEPGSTKLSISGSSAHYEDNSSVDTAGDGTKVPLCYGDFQLSDDIQTLHIDTNCDINGYAGYGVGFVGDYRKDLAIKNLTMETSEFFNGENEKYTTFKQLVGPYLKTFDDTVMMEEDSTAEEGSLQIAEFAVQHGFTSDESIVMASPDGKLWAAVIDWDQANEIPIIRYFTNVSEWKNKLPPEIEKWKEHIKDYKVVYQNK